MALTNEQTEIVKTFLPDFEVNDETTIEQVNEAFGKNYIKMDLHEAELNKKYIQGLAKAENRLAKVLGSEANGKKYDEMVELLESKMTEFNDKIKELSNSTTKTGKTDKELEGLLHEKEQLSNALKEAAEKLKSLESEKESLLADSEKKLEAYKLKTKVDGLWSGLNWTDDTNIYTKNGLWSTEIEGKVTFKEEDGDIIVYDATGENWLKDGVGKMTAQKYFNDIAEKAKALKKNGATHVKTEGEKKAEGLPANQAAYIERMKKIRDAQTAK